MTKAQRRLNVRNNYVDAPLVGSLSLEDCVYPGYDMRERGARLTLEERVHGSHCSPLPMQNGLVSFWGFTSRPGWHTWQPYTQPGRAQVSGARRSTNNLT